MQSLQAVSWDQIIVAKKGGKSVCIINAMHLHSCLVHEFHQQKHELHHSKFGLQAIFLAEFHWYKRGDVYSFPSFPLIELCNQPTTKG